MNMQYARAVLAHEQAYRDRARAAQHGADQVHVAPRINVDGQVAAAAPISM